MTKAYLPTRSLIRISGKDAQDFLHSLITTDVEGLPENEARPGALLTPQGKILFDFSIWRDVDGFIVETDASQREALTKRLMMYKLRAAVDLAALPEDGVTVFWGEDADQGMVVDGGFAKAGIALFRTPGQHAEDPAAAYQSLRIDAGLVVSGEDYALQDAFPHDILLDKNGGLSFRKGCYVGQEVVSRMQHRGTARRRVAQVTAGAVLPAAGTEITANGKPVGTLGSVSGKNALAIVRIDRVGDAVANGVPLLAGGVPVTIELPAWTGLTFPAETEGAQQ
ncbi:CAF17-like 4Fe-4S cluster assembly/insertion protein YgfZ [Aliirhizobium smilacinae]|uniref:Folate-binding protein YgfZ n=1 Tax=Aliirhizobium smilacinae TaxID=1395944 RepID=A0A5C4XQ89_9HYPH|nr:folate-binding protein YgfZ [Rhizobium smilacinae]TNM65562.1 folate-binding protein YgfZ [Rhizobium smilacinae]